MRTFILSTALLLGFAANAQYPKYTEANWRLIGPGYTDTVARFSKVDVFAALQTKLPMADPARGGNDSLNTAVEVQDWAFEKVFTVPKNGKNEFGELILDGVDTYAEVFLNGTMLVQTNNAFKEYRADISKAVVEGVNRLRISFHSPINRDLPQANSSAFTYPADSDTHPKKTSVFTRKPTYHFGWDFSPRRINYSVRSLRIEPVRAFAIKEVQVVPYNSGKSTTLMIQAVVTATKKQQVEMSAGLEGPYGWTKQNLLPGINKINFEIEVPVLRRWSPNGSGEQNSYTINVNCRKGNQLESVHQQFGVHAISLAQGEDETGRKFQFLVNGIPTFAKGFNYIQAENPVSEQEVKAWRDAGVNMIRVWGGGSYGDDELYNLCDKYGIMIWQDFMFANTMYPNDGAFFRNVTEEATYQIKRLRNHPCLVLWCGNNEVDVAWKNWGWMKKYGYTEDDSLKLVKGYQILFDSILPTLVHQLDPGRDYLGSSPVSNWGKEQDFLVGDNHFWGVFHGEMPIEAYNTHVPRFASEFGMQSYPDYQTLREFVPLEKLTLNSPEIKRLQLSYKGNPLLEKYQEMVTGRADNLEEFIYNSQVVQAEALKIAISAHRRNMDRCGGSLFWQWNDVAPVASWSVIDINNRKKAAYNVVMKSFQSLMISPVLTGNSLEVWLINDNDPRRNLTLRISLKNFNGQVLQTKNIPATASLNASLLAYTADLSEWVKDEDRQSTYLLTELLSGDQVISSSPLYFDALKNLALPDPEFRVQPADKGIRISWNKYAVYPMVQLAGETWFPDPETRSLFIPFDAKLIRGVKVRSLNYSSN